MSLKNTKSEIYIYKIMVKISCESESDISSKDYTQPEIEAFIFMHLSF